MPLAMCFEKVDVEDTDVEWIKLRLPNGKQQKLTPDKSGALHYIFDKSKQRYVRKNHNQRKDI